MARPKKPTLKKRPDGRYRCKYQDLYFYGDTPEEAFALRDEYKRQLAAGRVVLRTDTVRHYVTNWLPVHKAGVSKRYYNDCAAQLDKLIAVIGYKELKAVTVDDAAAVWVQFVGKSASLIRKARILYTAVFDSAMENDLCAKNPFRFSTAAPPKGYAGTHRAITKEERGLIETVPHRMQAPAMLMLYAGLRRGEMIPFNCSEDVKAGSITVSRAVRYTGNQPEIVDPKTEAGKRTVPVFSPLEPFLRNRIGLICPSASGTVMSKQAFFRAWNSYMTALSRAAGHPVSIRPHDLRHSFCTMLRDYGVDLKQAMLWLGHADEKMILKIYDHVEDARTAASVALVETGLNGGQNGGQIQSSSR